MHINIGMPLQLTIIGMPIAIIAFIALQRSAMPSMPAPSIGAQVMVMPSFVISQVTRHIIGMAIIIGIIGMPPIIPGIIDGIIPFMPFMGAIIPGIIEGIIPPMGIGMGIIIGMPCIAPPDIGI